MRIAALAFGVISGLVASLILALGGLDAGVVGAHPDPQIQIGRFALFIIANLGVFGAGLALASPLGAAVLFVVGAVSWIAAALILHHTTNLVVIVPPLLLLIATALSLVALFRGGRGFALPPLSLGGRGRARRPDSSDREEYDDGDEPQLGGLDGRDSPPVDWQPGKRRPPPPRQKPMFRPADDEIEESGLSRVARGTSSVLSFALYGAIAVAVLLVFWNLRGGDQQNPAAAKVEPAPVTSAVADATPAAPVLAQPATTPRTVAPQPDAPAADDQTTSIPPQLLNGVVVANDPNSGVTFEAPSDVLSGGDISGGATQPDQTADQAPASDLSAAPTDNSGSTVMPFPMPPQIAAQRNGPSSRPAQTPRAATPPPSTGLNTTGL